jgi:hypothetical protein
MAVVICVKPDATWKACTTPFRVRSYVYGSANLVTMRVRNRYVERNVEIVPLS